MSWLDRYESVITKMHFCNFKDGLCRTNIGLRFKMHPSYRNPLSVQLKNNGMIFAVKAWRSFRFGNVECCSKL